MSPFSDCLVCPFVRWLGVHPSDIKSLANNSQALTPRDIKKIDNLLARSYVKGDLSLKNQVSFLKYLPEKLDLYLIFLSFSLKFFAEKM